MSERAEVAVVAAARAEAGVDDDEEQMGLFAEPETEQGRLKVQHVRRGPGRPPGARNRRVERTAAWLLSRHKDPVEGLLEVADMHPADLAVLLSCSMLEAVQEQRLCRIAAAPFVRQRQPLAVDVTDRKVVYLTIHEGGQASPSTEGVGFAARVVSLAQIEQNQQLSDASDPATDSDATDSAS